MALVKCTECNNQISTTADFCPHCGAKAKILVSMPQSPVQSKKTGVTHVSKWTVISLFAVITIGLLSISGGKRGRDEPKTEQDESSMAFIQCKAFVKEQLKAPSTADFGEYWDSHVMQVTDPGAKLGENTYQVTSYVDAQNSFGAKLRNKFTCTERWNGQDDADIRNWTLKDLTYDGARTDFTPSTPAGAKQSESLTSDEEMAAFLRPFKTYKHIPLQQLLTGYGLKISSITITHDDALMQIGISERGKSFDSKPGDLFVDIYLEGKTGKPLPCGIPLYEGETSESTIVRGSEFPDTSNTILNGPLLHWAATGKCPE